MPNQVNRRCSSQVMDEVIFGNGSVVMTLVPSHQALQSAKDKRRVLRMALCREGSDVVL